mmetsp:Transcript_64265/g.172017  ORF Transcript_64265/g.172017 Transcript_64265/m.172017 type:complete len:293 (-) Transcript_64265:197-1075(-)|eukprot:CAMPEP_0113696308 /NCGR_PEP_ID=MMETSP0038_2-20120614/21407_1 /TAXON_ID=2898 /ORGANISM="Cryptomonas paramecium" /LENGTH=292 /DNA_ID=CAMNT_0000618995 /DNA_START=114 /DNA_END=992 /DNA_ORIENTATION=+ /assembly_acc=CAM_ASM_000170
MGISLGCDFSFFMENEETSCKDHDGSLDEFDANPCCLLNARFPHLVEYVNERWCQMWGYSFHELIGTSIEMLCGPGTDKRKLSEFLSPPHSCVVSDIDFVAYTKSGLQRRVELWLMPQGPQRSDFIEIVAGNVKYPRDHLQGRNPTVSFCRDTQEKCETRPTDMKSLLWDLPTPIMSILLSLPKDSYDICIGELQNIVHYRIEDLSNESSKSKLSRPGHHDTGTNLKVTDLVIMFNLLCTHCIQESEPRSSENRFDEFRNPSDFSAGDEVLVSSNGFEESGTDFSFLGTEAF